jgi:transcriptional regulator with XRE-family HTH domain
MLLLSILGRMKRLPFDKIETFGERLRLLRTLFQITQEQLASHTGLLQGTLTKIERDVYTPDQGIIDRIGAFFQVTEAYLQYGEAPIFVKRLAFCDLFLSGPGSLVGFRQFLREGGLATAVSHLAEVDKVKRCLKSQGRRGTYVISYQNRRHIIIRTDNTASVDRALLAKGVGVEILSDEGVVRDTSRMYVYRRAKDDDQGSLSEKLRSMINERLRKLFGAFSPDDVLTRAAILEATPKWRLIVSFCRRIGAREADLVKATKEYPTLQEDE